MFPQIIVQELDDQNQQLASKDDLALFVRRWNPSTLTLSAYQELVVKRKLAYFWFFFWLFYHLI